ncbi:hypothetical protein PVAND_015629 [Polypedilum vanderplanki]|uniref:Uncharacterized protein n=1 Tax=Polypedilum vanderplanki TaxID=319348 RepID=A0A9J6BDF4_POLVA|nr:hypothetical protein PVAND_015629 [Polypedilum vanderplanki]
MTNSKISSFANESSIHGIKFIFNPKSHKISRLLWTLSFTLSIFGLIYYSKSVFVKYNSKPDFGVKIQQVAISKIPFPAVTICAPFFASPEFANFNEIMSKITNDNATEKEIKYFIANLFACDSKFLGNLFLEFNLTNFNIVELIKESSVNRFKFLNICEFEMYRSECHEIFTDRGICYTENLQHFETIYDNNSISNDFYFESNQNSETIWSLDRGYFDKSSQKIPFRANKKNIFTAIIAMKNSIADNVCISNGKSFTFILHLPNEIPTFFHDQFSLPYENIKTVTLTATKFKADEELKNYSPKIRSCYFENEKKLKFFKSYTKNICDLECLANKTLEICGCVKFSMPREEGTPVCGLDKIECYLEVIDNWPEEDIEAPCDCLKTCNDIEYSIRYEKLSNSEHIEALIEKIEQENLKNGTITELFIGFKDHIVTEYETFVAYKLQNLIADIGGLLGLFLGCSVLSLIEIIYYFYEILKGKRNAANDGSF